MDSAPTIDRNRRRLARITVILYSLYRSPPSERSWSVGCISFDQLRYSFPSKKIKVDFSWKNQKK